MINLAGWQQLQDALAAITGVTIETYDNKGILIGESSNPSILCELIRKSPRGEEVCGSHCDKCVSQALQRKKPFFFNCPVNLRCFAVPVVISEKERLTIIGGKVFLSHKDFSDFSNISHSFGISLEQILEIVKEIRFVDEKTLGTICGFIDTSANILFKNIYSEENLTHRLSQVLTILNICADLSLLKTEQDLFDTLFSTLGFLFNLSSLAVMTLNEEDNTYKTSHTFGEHRETLSTYAVRATMGVFGRVKETGRPVICTDNTELSKVGLLKEINNCVLIPLLREDRVEKILCAFNVPASPAVRQPSEEIVNILTSFSRIVNLALDNLYLSSITKEKQRDLNSLIEVMKAMESVIEVQELSRVILDKTMELIKAEQGSVMLYDRNRDVLEVMAIRGISQKLVEHVKIRPGEAIAGRALQQSVPVLVKDIEKDERFRQRNRPRYKTRSFISMPIKADGRALGVLNASDKVTGETFTEEDVELLLPIISHVSVVIQRAEFHKEYEVLREISITDPLTGLLNRRYFEERLTEEIERAKRHQLFLSLVMADIDDFKSYNDAFGHLAGDEILKAIASTLKEMVRTIDVVARFGGEEFTIILPQTRKDAAAVIAERIRREIERTSFKREEVLPRGKLTLSLGLASFPEDAQDLTDLINNADKALYRAKAAGRNRVVMYGT